jgi:hypothetical protein
MKPSPHPTAPKADAASAKGTGRRRLVVGAGVAAGAAVAVAALHRGAEPGTAVAATKPDSAAGEGYRLTDHIRRYYETTRT